MADTPWVMNKVVFLFHTKIDGSLQHQHQPQAGTQHWEQAQPSPHLCPRLNFSQEINLKPQWGCTHERLIQAALTICSSKTISSKSDMRVQG